MGVGSQRAALEKPELEDSFVVVREEAPHAFLCANLGIIQLRDHGIEWAERAVEMIDADAIAIHINSLQEAIQPEGDHNAEGCLEALRNLCEEFSYPVIVKETGSGISAGTARAIWGAGASAHRYRRLWRDVLGEDRVSQGERSPVLPISGKRSSPGAYRRW